MEQLRLTVVGEEVVADTWDDEHLITLTWDEWQDVSDNHPESPEGLEDFRTWWCD